MNVILFWIFSILFILVRVRFHRPDDKEQVEFSTTREHWLAGQFSVALLLSHGWWVTTAEPADNMSLLMILGVLLMGTSIPLLYWVHHCLGRFFSARLVIQTEHRIIKEGPYRWIRHPMYTVGFCYLIGAGLLSQSTVVLFVPTLSFTLLVVTRISDEESMLEANNPDYTIYKQSTGRFFPKVW